MQNLKSCKDCVFYSAPKTPKDVPKCKLITIVKDNVRTHIEASLARSNIPEFCGPSGLYFVSKKPYEIPEMPKETL